MEFYFNVPKEETKIISSTMSLIQFKALLKTNKPLQIYNSDYSSEKPCWYITEYFEDDKVKYYADNWADKTAKTIAIDDLYQSWKIQGLEKSYFKKEIYNG